VAVSLLTLLGKKCHKHTRVDNCRTWYWFWSYNIRGYPCFDEGTPHYNFWRL